MWQRKQTIYLLLITTLLVCLQFLPVVSFVDTNDKTSSVVSGLQGVPKELYCAAIYDANSGEYVFGWITSLAIVSILVAMLTFLTIFDYKNRKRQMSACRLGQILLLVWCVLLFAVVYSMSQIQIKFGFCLPIVSLILFQLAHMGVKHDDDLVRSADRLR